VDDAAFGGIEDAEGERAAVFSHLLAGEAGHRLELGFPRLAEALGIADDPLAAVELAPEDLEKNDLKGVKQLSVLGKREAGIFAAKVQYATLTGLACRHLKLETEVGNQLGQKFLGVLAGFVHIARVTRLCERHALAFETSLFNGAHLQRDSRLKA